MAKTPVVNHFVTTKYMNRFKCIGPECEDVCCQWWNVPVDQEHFNRYQTEFQNSPAMKKIKDDYIEELSPQNQQPDSFGRIKMKDDGVCPFLSDDKLCDIQKNYGEDMLPNICATFPRLASMVDYRLELTGTLSCPEIARLCLLPSDAMELEGFNPNTLPRQRFDQNLVKNNNDPYTTYFDDVRDTIQTLMSNQEFSVDVRMLAIASFANQVTPFFHKNCRVLNSNELLQQIKIVTEKSFLTDLQSKIEQVKPTDEKIISLILTILVERLQKQHTLPFRKLVLNGLMSYEMESGNQAYPDLSNVNLKVSHSELAVYYNQRKQKWMSAFGERIEQYFEHYCQNYWFKEWYVYSQNLSEHMTKLSILIAIIRFLFFSHLSLYQIEEKISKDTQENLITILDQSAVEAFYIFSRNIEHSKQHIQQIQQTLDKMKVRSFEDQVKLILF